MDTILPPDIVIGGAPKCGTTSLHDAIAEHPDVFMTSIKEPHYFIQRDGKNPYGRYYTEEEYLELFMGAKAGQLRGESSTWYLYNSTITASRIKNRNPSAKLIFAFRDPLERIESDYWFHIHRGSIPSTQSLIELVEDEAHWIHNGSRLSEHVREFQQHFGPSSLKYVLFEDIRNDYSATIRSVFDFIGIDFPSGTMQSVSSNRTVYPRSDKVVRRFHWPALHGTTFVPRLNRAIRSRLLFSKYARRPIMDTLTRERIVHTYRDEVNALSRLIDRDLSGWLS